MSSLVFTGEFVYYSCSDAAADQGVHSRHLITCKHIRTFLLRVLSLPF